MYDRKRSHWQKYDVWYLAGGLLAAFLVLFVVFTITGGNDSSQWSGPAEYVQHLCANHGNVDNWRLSEVEYHQVTGTCKDGFPVFGTY